MEVSTRQLRAFCLAAQHQSFARAAEALYITPSGLSVLIKELESRVGFRLFDRTTRHVDLTPNGREFLAVIQRSLEELDAAIAHIGRGSKRNQQSISLGTTALVAANILPPAMREFRKRRPDVQIRLFDADLPTLIQMVEAGKLDMSLGIFKAMPDVRRDPFFRFSLMVARAAKDEIQPRKTTTWSALEGETLISLSHRMITTSQLINPVVRFDFHMISRRGIELPPGAEEFTSFLKSYIATWAGRAGVL
jgi:DNA-binding transcriptional LysR family regulator